MPIVNTDLVMRLSVVTASAGDTQAGTPATSLGDQVSTTALTNATIENLFDNVPGSEAAAGRVEHRCVFILNNHGSLTATNTRFGLTSQTAGGGTIDFGVDPAAKSAKGSASAQAATIASETAVPAGVTFAGTEITLGDLAPGEVRGVWLRRTVTAGAGAVNPDGAIMYATCDTLP
jgi:hypothetical protein